MNDLATIDDAELVPATPVLTRLQIEKAFAGLGLTRISAARTRHLATLGIDMEQSGPVRVNQGALLVSQQVLTNMVVQIGKKLRNSKLTGEERHALVHELAQLTLRISQTAKISMDAPAKLETGGGPRKRSSFIPGSVVTEKHTISIETKQQIPDAAATV